MRYEKSGPWSGMVIVVVDGAAIMGATTAASAGTRGAGAFTDAAGLSAYAGNAAGVLFAIALLDTSVIGAFAVSLSTSYALGDVLGLNHSPHRSIKQAQRPRPAGGVGAESSQSSECIRRQCPLICGRAARQACAWTAQAAGISR
jgi:hypothetical protein